MEDRTRSVWGKPELIVLVRSRPEEAVLQACKATHIAHDGPSDPYQACRYFESGCMGLTDS